MTSITVESTTPPTLGSGVFNNISFIFDGMTGIRDINREQMADGAVIRPQVKTCMMEAASLMADGGVTGNNGIGWGGVDEAGNKDPDANSTDIWDDNVWANEPSSFYTD